MVARAGAAATWVQVSREHAIGLRHVFAQLPLNGQFGGGASWLSLDSAACFLGTAVIQASSIQSQ